MSEGPYQGVEIPSAGHSRRGRVLPWAFLLLGVVGSLWLWDSKRHDAMQVAADRFQLSAYQVRAAIDESTRTYLQVLRGGAGLFAASKTVGREEWRRFAAAVGLPEALPGMQGLGYAIQLDPGEVDALEHSIRAEGFEGFSVYPKEGRDAYTAIIYLEPFDWRNRPAFGYDMFSEPVRREAMVRARDSGRPALCAKIVLRQEAEWDLQPGYLIYLPVYRPDMPTATVEQRRAALQGYVYAPFRSLDFMTEAMRAAGSPDIHVEVFDGDKMTENSLLFDSSIEARHGQYPSALRKIFTYDLLGHQWTVLFSSTPTFDARIDRQTPLLLLAGGLLISGLLFAITWSQARTRSRAVMLATEMTAATSDRTQQLREITSTVGEGIYVVDHEGRITFANPAACAMLGWSEEQLLGASAHDLFHQHGDDAMSISRCTYQRAAGAARSFSSDDENFRDRNGRLIPVSMVAAPMQKPSGITHSVVAFHDISERRQAEAAARENERFRVLFEYAREAFFLVDPGGRVTDVNRIASEALGYSRGELVGNHCDKFAPGLDGQFSVCNMLEHPDFGAGTRTESEFVRRDGSRFPVELVASPVEQESRRLLLLSVRDISERREAEASAHRLLEELERAKSETERVNNELARSNAELQRLSQVDPLTGVANRRYFDQVLDIEWGRAVRDREPLSLIILDVDFFKAYNDCYGHQAGDEGLRRIAAALSDRLGRPSDLLARYGGEEFVVVLPQTHGQGAVYIAETLRAAVEALGIRHERSEVADRITISLGVATAHPTAAQPSSALVQAADEALYQVKREGRNHVRYRSVDGEDDAARDAPT